MQLATKHLRFSSHSQHSRSRLRTTCVANGTTCTGCTAAGKSLHRSRWPTDLHTSPI